MFRYFLYWLFDEVFCSFKVVRNSSQYLSVNFISTMLIYSPCIKALIYLCWYTFVDIPLLIYLCWYTFVDIRLLIHIEPNKSDNVYSKIWHIFVWSNIEKIGRILFYQINLMKKSQSKLKSPRVKKELTPNEWTRNILFEQTAIHDFKLYSLSLQLENIK